MTGIVNSDTERGIIPNAIHHIFKHIADTTDRVRTLKSFNI